MHKIINFFPLPQLPASSMASIATRDIARTWMTFFELATFRCSLHHGEGRRNISCRESCVFCVKLLPNIARGSCPKPGDRKIDILPMQWLSLKVTFIRFRWASAKVVRKRGLGKECWHIDNVFDKALAVRELQRGLDVLSEWCSL